MCPGLRGFWDAGFAVPKLGKFWVNQDELVTLSEIIIMKIVSLRATLLFPVASYLQGDALFGYRYGKPQYSCVNYIRSEAYLN